MDAGCEHGEEKGFCLHYERRVVRRKSAFPAASGGPAAARPDLVINLCHFPLPSASGIQCAPLREGGECPHGGPYSLN